MSEYLKKYLEMGLSRIVVVENEFKESKDGRIDSTYEFIVASDGKRFVEVHTNESNNFRPPSQHDFSIGSPLEISEARYNELAAGKPISDSPQVLLQLEQAAQTAVKSRAASERLKAGAPSCPKCNAEMTPRNGPHGRFWGCKSFPGCNGTVNFSAHDAALYKASSKF